MGRRGPKPKIEVLWTPEVAYAVGLIAADGCLSPDGRHLSLVSKDIEQILNLKYCLGLRARLGVHSPGKVCRALYYRIQWGDITFYRFLLDVGLTKNKSQTIGHLKVPDTYFFDFLRGSFDGDGSFYSYYDQRWPRSFMFYLEFISASETHVSWIRERLMHHLGVTGHISRSKSSCVLQLKYAKRESLLILKQLYPQTPTTCLSRKRLKIRKALRIVGLSLSDS